MEMIRSDRVLYTFLGSAIGFIDRLEVGWKRKRRIKDDAKTIGLSNWKDRISIY